MSKYSMGKGINFRPFTKAAQEYLALEIKLRKVQAQRKALVAEEYRLSRKMEDISFKELGLIGHQLVDQMRDENAKRAKGIE